MPVLNGNDDIMTLSRRVVYEFVRDLVIVPARPGRRHLPIGVAAVAATAIVVPAVFGSPSVRAMAVDPAIVIQRDVHAELVVDVAPEVGLQVKTILAARAISAEFPEIHSIGGVRADGLKWHPSGQALDVMIPDYRSPAGVALGDRIVAYVRANADRFALNHLIWRRVLYLPNGTVRTLADRGSEDANHVTHLHIATNGGGFPNGRERYFTTADGVPGVVQRA